MIREVKFESQDRRIKQILAALNANGIKDIEEANAICESYGLDPYKTCEETQPICFENAKWAYVVGAAIALKKGCKNAADAAEAIGIGLQSFCIPGSVADDRKVGLGHGNLAARLLREETKCFAFLAGHESFAAAEGAIKIAAKADKVRKEPLRCILNGLGKDAAQIISRINGFTYVQTQFDYYTGELKVVREIAYSKGERAKVKCYGADDVREGVAIMWHEGVDVSITGNSTNPTRFQHPVAGTYKKECVEKGKKYFSVASGGGTGRTLHPDNMAAGPASYGMTDTMGRMHSDAQFAGSSSVPAHVEMMGFLGIGNELGGKHNFFFDHLRTNNPANEDAGQQCHDRHHYRIGDKVEEVEDRGSRAQRLNERKGAISQSNEEAHKRSPHDYRSEGFTARAMGCVLNNGSAGFH